MRRLLKALKIAGLVLGVLLVTAALLVLWLVRRAWPQVDGRVAIAGL